jgi:hypothetical protein
MMKGGGERVRLDFTAASKMKNLHDGERFIFNQPARRSVCEVPGVRLGKPRRQAALLALRSRVASGGNKAARR